MAAMVKANRSRRKRKKPYPKAEDRLYKVFGYFIEVTKSYMNMVPDRYIRKQTLANCERYITQELKEVENTYIGAF